MLENEQKFLSSAIKDFHRAAQDLYDASPGLREDFTRFMSQPLTQGCRSFFSDAEGNPDYARFAVEGMRQLMLVTMMDKRNEINAVMTYRHTVGLQRKQTSKNLTLSNVRLYQNLLQKTRLLGNFIVPADQNWPRRNEPDLTKRILWDIDSMQNLFLKACTIYGNQIRQVLRPQAVQLAAQAKDRPKALQEFGEHAAVLLYYLTRSGPFRNDADCMEKSSHLLTQHYDFFKEKCGIKLRPLKQLLRHDASKRYAKHPLTRRVTINQRRPQLG